MIPAAAAETIAEAALAALRFVITLVGHQTAQQMLDAEKQAALAASDAAADAKFGPKPR